MNAIEQAYKYLFKPLAFRRDPEAVHDRVLQTGKLVGNNSALSKLTSVLLDFKDPILTQTILGITFTNPLGLAAGFDKNAELTETIPLVGFGFEEVGSITGEACAGNDKPRLWRLPDSRSLVVYYGLKNDGAETIATRLQNKQFKIPIGISVAKTNNPETVYVDAGIADYVKAYQAFASIGSYTTINISCPNTYGGEPFTDPQRLDRLLNAIDQVPTTKPVFIKLSPDVTFEQVDQLLEVIQTHRVHGIISSNLTKNRSNEKIIERVVPKTGGLSGKVVEQLSNDLLAYLYRRTRGNYVLIGCGGVFSAADAYKKIRLGASLIQLITGMIYQGPQLIGQINKGLATMLRNDGFNNISEAIGVDNR